MQNIKDRIAVRDLEPADVSQLADFWYHSPIGYIESLGVDPTKLPAEEEFLDIIMEIVSGKNNLFWERSILTVTFDDMAIGSHSLGFRDQFKAIFHAQIWNPDHRGQGIGTISYPLACRVFVDRFNLQEIFFYTPRHNIAANRIKEKLGLESYGSGPLDNPVVYPDTEALYYRLTREKIMELTS